MKGIIIYPKTSHEFMPGNWVDIGDDVYTKMHNGDDVDTPIDQFGICSARDMVDGNETTEYCEDSKISGHYRLFMPDGQAEDLRKWAIRKRHKVVTVLHGAKVLKL